MHVVLAAAKPWTYWLSFVFIFVAFLAIMVTLLGYFIRVTMAKYPGKR